LPDRTNTTRVLFLPDDQSVILIEVHRPVEELLADIRAGRWTPPEPYGVLLTVSNEPLPADDKFPRTRNRPPRLRSIRYGNLVVIIPARCLPSGLNPSDETPAIQLSQRQRQVLECLCDGLNDKQIAELLGLNLRTVAYHVAEIKARLGAVSRAQAVSRAAALGILRGRKESRER
jgi:DNA-binding CsgD family transcriptional regulator